MPLAIIYDNERVQHHDSCFVVEFEKFEYPEKHLNWTKKSTVKTIDFWKYKKFKGGYKKLNENVSVKEIERKEELMNKTVGEIYFNE